LRITELPHGSGFAEQVDKLVMDLYRNEREREKNRERMRILDSNVHKSEDRDMRNKFLNPVMFR